jgi:pimeloyl-ACP methyl ester carboxylesterase
MTRAANTFLLVAALGPAPGLAGAQASAVRDEPIADTEIVRQQPYQRFFTQDRFDRRIVFYVSEETDDAGSLPLVVYVHGSGAQSHFVEVDGRLQGRNGHSSFADVVRGRARLLIVEKPGVKFLDAPADPGGATDASPMFRMEHTLERWTEAVRAASAAGRKLPGIRAGAVLVVGHSEGGIVAAKLAAECDWITHVAVLAGGGPTQLFDLILLARAGTFFRRISDDADARVDYVLEEWKKILARPDDADRLFFGHPCRRWSSFLRTSTLEQLLRTRARIYVAQGTEDRAVAWESFEVLRAELQARARDATFDTVAGADHSLVIAAAGGRTDGWPDVLQRVVAWFLGP